MYSERLAWSAGRYPERGTNRGCGVREGFEKNPWQVSAAEVPSAESDNGAPGMSGLYI
jgi:hypothetical protein